MKNIVTKMKTTIEGTNRIEVKKNGSGIWKTK